MSSASICIYSDAARKPHTILRRIKSEQVFLISTHLLLCLLLSSIRKVRSHPKGLKPSDIKKQNGVLQNKCRSTHSARCQYLLVPSQTKGSKSKAKPRSAFCSWKRDSRRFRGNNSPVQLEVSPCIYSGILCRLASGEIFSCSSAWEYDKSCKLDLKLGTDGVVLGTVYIYHV